MQIYVNPKQWTNDHHAPLHHHTTRAIRSELQKGWSSIKPSNPDNFTKLISYQVFISVIPVFRAVTSFPGLSNFFPSSTFIPIIYTNNGNNSLHFKVYVIIWRTLHFCHMVPPAHFFFQSLSHFQTNLSHIDANLYFHSLLSRLFRFNGRLMVHIYA